MQEKGISLSETDGQEPLGGRFRPWSRGSRRTTITWGFVDQALSSITNFGLSLLAGRLLGPEGLGTVFLAFSIYLLFLMLQRALVTETLAVITSALDPEARDRTAGLGLTLSVLAGLAATAAVLILGRVLPGSGGAASLLLAPWLMVTMVQDFWRNLLFRERRAAAAAANDGVWLLVMVAALPLAWALNTTWAVMAVWGLGAFGGATMGFFQTRVSPGRVRASLTWWRREAWSFGRWNAAAGIVLNVSRSIGAFVLVAIVGARALGGFRAVESIFAPLSLIAPAVALPGLPVMARAYAVGYRQARGLAMRLSGTAVAASLAFFAFILLGGWHLLILLYGRSFSPYRNLVPPIVIGQLFAAAGIGFPLLMKVEQRGRVLLLSRLSVEVIGLGILVVSASNYGLVGAAWGVAGIGLISSLSLAYWALRRPKSTASPIPVRGSSDDRESD
jgi:O-antigen/teichoic acid export membrane protein